MKHLKLFDVSPSPFNGGIGIIQALSTFNPPWEEDNINPVILDTFYYGNHSGGKLISPLVSRYIDTDNPTLTPANVEGLAAIINALCHPTWARMWAVYKAEYEPAENYNMVEEGEREHTTEYGKTHMRTDNLQHTKTGTETETPNVTETRTANLTETDTQNLTETKTPNITETETPNVTETTTPNITTETEKEVYGFNSDSAVPSENITETQTGTSQKATTGTNTKRTTGTDEKRNTGTDTKTTTGTDATATTGTNQMQYNTTDADTGTQNDVDGGEDSETENHTLTRHGNIGVTTTQQMLQSDIDLWKWSFFYDVLFPSLDRVLTLPIY